MDNSFSDAGDQLFELGQSVKKKFVKDVVKGVAQSAKNQIVGAAEDKQKVDPMTNKPVPTKKMMTQLTQATKQLQQTKLQKIREELDKQRLKVTGADSAKASSSQAGPEIPVTKKPSTDDAVSKTLRNSQSTGEARGDLVG